MPSTIHKQGSVGTNTLDAEYTSNHDEYCSKNPFNKVQSLSSNIYSQLFYASKSKVGSEVDPMSYQTQTLNANRFKTDGSLPESQFPKMNFITKTSGSHPTSGNLPFSSANSSDVKQGFFGS